MSLEIYSKDPPKRFPSEKKGKDRYFFAFISLVGLAAVIFAAWPLLVWQVSTAPRLSTGVEDAPIPQARVLSAKSPNLENIQVVEDADGFSYFVPTNLPQNSASSENRPEKFSISIPKLNINNAVVKVDSLDFKKNLSHFPGSALPGEVGIFFIPGNSVLRNLTIPKITIKYLPSFPIWKLVTKSTSKSKVGNFSTLSSIPKSSTLVTFRS